MTTTAISQINKLELADTVSGIESTLPTYINLEKWEDVGYEWSGTIAPQDMQRLVNLVPEGYQGKPISLEFKLKKESQLLVLSMEFSGDIWVVCQRCLEPMSIDMSNQSQLVLLQSEEQKSLVDDTEDYLMLEELLSSQSGSKWGYHSLPVARLVEDELLLDVPLSAKHDECEMAVKQVGEIIEEEPENPFAALEKLKGAL